MKVFLSYASEDRGAADDIRHALNADGHDVFFDREDLPPGEEFHARIRRAIERADLLIFLVSPRAVDAGSYTLNELAIAERAWKGAAGRLLPVVLERVSVQALPPFLRSVTFLEPEGNVTAAVADAVHRRARERRGKVKWAAAAAIAASAVLAAFLYIDCGTPAVRDSADGAPAVLVPAGTFIFGDDEAAVRREVYVDAFYMDRYEITTARYAKFLEAAGTNSAPDHWEERRGNESAQLPVVGVDWHDADAYCRWAGKRLPTEAEWEKAARGMDERRFPWGDAAPTLDHANYQNTSPEAYGGGLAAVGAHGRGASFFGIDDMAGNVAEWTADWYSESFARGAARNPQGPSDGEARVIRGGGRYDPDYRLAATARYYASPETRADDIGFRCAGDP